MNKKELKRNIMIEAARRSFYIFCCLLYPDFYRKDRTFLKELCDILQNFIEDPNQKVLFLSIPPRHGKSYTIKHLIKWLVGKYQNYKVMVASYNENFAVDYSKEIRDDIQMEKLDDDLVIYNDVFAADVKKGSSKARAWQTTNSKQTNVLATSPSGSATGWGCNLMIIDDIVKDAATAFNERLLEKHWNWFKDTMLSRLEGDRPIDRKIIIIGTRWSKRDLIGRYQNHCKKIGKQFKEIRWEAINEKGEMLCESLLPREEYEGYKLTFSPEIFYANYHQQPQDLKNQMYTYGFDTYNPEDFKDKAFDEIISYTDTADEGSDYLCSIFAGVYKRELYLLDVVYTKSKMEYTEPIVAERINRLKSTFNQIESNNGGKGFARNVKDILEKTFNNYYCIIDWFHQGNPKMARISAAAYTAQRKVKVPIDWGDKWPEFSTAIMEFKTDHNINDDAPDCLTGLVESALHRNLIDQ